MCFIDWLVKQDHFLILVTEKKTEQQESMGKKVVTKGISLVVNNIEEWTTLNSLII